MAYLYQLRNAFISRVKYRGNMLWGLAWGIVALLPQVFLWRALFGDSYTVAGVTLAQMMTFLVISRLVSQGISLKTGRVFEERMKSGDISLDMVRPSDPRLLASAQAAGESMVNILLEGLPVFLVAIVIVGGILPPETGLHFMLFMISVTLAIILSIVFQMLVGLAAFWFLSVWLLDWVLRFFLALFSGGIVPLWFMPQWVQHVAVWLPFQAMHFTPIQIYLGRYSVEESIMAIGVQVIWIILLYLVQKMLWWRGVHRIVVLGG